MAFSVVQKLDKDPKDITPDYTLDTLGEPCPYPAIVMLETMPQFLLWLFSRSGVPTKQQRLSKE